MLPASTKHRILVAGGITLLVTLVRLYGEIHHWSTSWFGPEPGGNTAVFGIAWLVPLFGVWFAQSLTGAADDRRSTWSAIGWPLGGIAVGAALIAALVNTLSPSVVGFIAVCTTSLVCAAAAYFAWPALFRANLGYAITARAPILLITVIAVTHDWGTHYEKTAPGSPPMPDAQRILVLCTAQVALWFPYTVLVGGLFGGLFARRRRP